MNRHAEKTAIVTAGAVSIGRAGVERMAEGGAQVAILDRLEAEREALATAGSAQLCSLLTGMFEGV